MALLTPEFHFSDRLRIEVAIRGQGIAFAARDLIAARSGQRRVDRRAVVAVEARQTEGRLPSEHRALERVARGQEQQRGIAVEAEPDIATLGERLVATGADRGVVEDAGDRPARLARYGSQAAVGSGQPEADPALVGARGIPDRCGENKSRRTREDRESARRRSPYSRVLPGLRTTAHLHRSLPAGRRSPLSRAAVQS